MSIAVHKPYVALCNNECVIVHNIKINNIRKIILPDLDPNQKVDIHNNEDIEAYHMITVVIFSDDGKYLAVCTNRKQLCLYETKNFSLLSNQTLIRAASRVKFTPDNDIVVADKAGDVYLFPSNLPMKSKTWLLGHLSMLLDVLVTSDSQFILTTDREEKIKVSNFDRCYNIEAYCLGHKRFVTNILELPHLKHVLISCGGDGTLRLWDYKYGSQIMCENLCDKMVPHDIKNLAQHLRDNNCHEPVDALPIKHLAATRCNDNESMIVISFYNSEHLLVYSIHSTNIMLNQFEVCYLGSVSVGVEPIECLLCKQNLWVLTDAGLQVYKYYDSQFVTHSALQCMVESLNKSWETLRHTITKQNLLSILYKRKLDSLQEYIAKKRLRIASKSQQQICE